MKYTFIREGDVYWFWSMRYWKLRAKGWGLMSDNKLSIMWVRNYRYFIDGKEFDLYRGQFVDKA